MALVESFTKNVGSEELVEVVEVNGLEVAALHLQH
jgi:hypothetical protein